jgi:hypothetical protein
MKSRILVILTILAVVAVTTAIASKSCPVGKSDCQFVCQKSGACELGKGCGIKDQDKGCDKDKDKDPNSDPNSQK